MEAANRSEFRRRAAVRGCGSTAALFAGRGLLNALCTKLWNLWKRALDKPILRAPFSFFRSFGDAERIPQQFGPFSTPFRCVFRRRTARFAGLDDRPGDRPPALASAARPILGQLSD